MEPLKQILLILMFLIGHSVFAQTPEQQKMIDKATKTHDSLLACMNLNDVLKQAEARQKKLDLDKKNNSSPAKQME